MFLPRVVVAHGAGSAPVVAQTAFAGADATSFWLAGHGPEPGSADDGATDRAHLDALVRRARPDVVAGISYGAHQVARWAAAGIPSYVRGLALVMPAWTGAPDATAAITAAQAEAFAAVGVGAELARVVAAWPGWVSDALAASWPAHDDVRIAAALRAVAASRGPTEPELAGLAGPISVVALADDPLHPEPVARRWAAAIPGAALTVVRATCLADLGAAALGGLKLD